MISSLKFDVLLESVVEIDADHVCEAADMVDENDKETGRVAGGDGPSNSVAVSISKPLAFGERGCGSGCGGGTGGIGKLETGADCTCRKYVVKYMGRMAMFG